MSEITFDIQGKYITDTVRELFYSGVTTYDKAIEILIHSMSGTAETYSQLKRHSEDILLGRAALEESTRKGIYCLKIFDPGEEESLPQNMNIWEGIKKLKDQEEKIKDLQYRWDVAMNLISEDFKHDIRQALGEEEPEESPVSSESHITVKGKDYLSGPISQEDIQKFSDENHYVEGVVKVHISDMIDNDLESFLDMISIRLVDSELLMDVNYSVIGLCEDEPDTLYLLVRGDASMTLDDTDDDEVEK